MIKANITQEELDELVEDDYSNTYQSLPARAAVERDVAMAEMARRATALMEQISIILHRWFDK